MKTLLFLVYLCLISFFTCQSAQDATTTNQHPFDNAHWLEDGVTLPENDSLFYLEHPAPLFRKEFSSSKAIQAATLNITAAGYYKVFVNGNGIKENVLDPAWTDFSKRIYYEEYDVTSMLRQGPNCIGIALGNGFFNPLPLRKWGNRNLREDTHVGKPVFIAKLIINYTDGSVEEIVTDQTWKYAPGPMIKNSVYLGIVYNANNEMEGWNLAGFDDQKWKSASIGTSPGGSLEKAFFPPVEITREIIPIEIYSPQNGVWMVDMGENFTGTYKMKLAGNAGDTVVFRFGERIYDNGTLNPMTTVIGQIKRKGMGGPGAPEIAWQTDHYIFNEKTEQWFRPDFTYHTYRYMEISGLNKKPGKEDIIGLFMNTNVPQPNHFSTSSDLLNSIQKACERTFLSNLISVQSDCPAREKFGYGGDLNATSEAYIFNFDMQSFYRKTIYDWVDAMKDSSFVDTAPYVGIEYCGISWESAFLITQYYLYLYYNDTSIIKELYERNVQWMEKVAMIHPEGIVKTGLSDHESLEPVPVQLTGTCHYLQCAQIMEEFAEVMGREDDTAKYASLASKLRNQIKEQFWDNPFEGEINKQTLFSTLLYHDIIPEDERFAAVDSLLLAVKNGPSSHFNTGIFGTKYVLEALSQNGNPNTVFDIVNSKDYPGWGHMIDQGATTIWETWKESDNVYSNNHPMFGSVSEWFYRWLGGIRPDPNHPGFKEFYIAPSIPDGLAKVNCTYQSPHGSIVSNWEKTTSGEINLQLRIPEGTQAKVSLPISSSQKFECIDESGKNLTKSIGGLQSGKFSLPEGTYYLKSIPATE